MDPIIIHEDATLSMANYSKLEPADSEPDRNPAYATISHIA